MRTETNACLLAGCGGLFVVFVVVFPLMVLGSHQQKKIEEHEQTMAKPVDTIEVNHVTFEKVVLDGHEYWYARGYREGGGLTHSASCPCKNSDLR